MRAALLDRYGSSADITVRDVPVPRIGPGEVLVRVHAASVNGGELLMIRGALGPLSGRRFPKGLGMDFSGTVAAAGAAVRDLDVGDRVWGLIRSVPLWRAGAPGAVAEYLAVGREQVQRLPAPLSLADAASLPVVGPTAVRAVDVVARVRAGEDVLVRGGAGGVGSMMVQLAHSSGAHVTALAGAANATFISALGADVVLDHRTTAAADLPRYDVVLDAVGSDLPAYRRLLRPRGRMVAVALDPALRGILAVAASRVHSSRRIRFSREYPGPAEYDALARAIAQGRCRPVIGGRFPLHEAAAAYRAAEDGGVRGKLVIDVEDGDGGVAGGEGGRGVHG